MYEKYKYKIRKAVSLLLFRKNKLKKMKRLIDDKEFTIISNNCVGGLIYKDLQRKFLTPTIALFIKNNDFVKFINNLEEYIYNNELVEIEIEGIEYPCGKLGDITIHFMHYKSFKEAREKWNKRKKRIIYSNIIIFMSKDETYDEFVAKEFNKVKYKKVLYTQNKDEKYNYMKYIPGFDKGYLEDITRYYNIFGTKLYEYNFDIVKFINNGDLG